MLWYLVLPPFIVILSLGVLLWYLSRRMNDEEVSRKLSIAEAEAISESHSRSLHRKALLLKLLEKQASRFKTGTLRIHNFFQSSLERLRQRRTELDAMRRHIDGDRETVEVSGVPSQDKTSPVPPRKARFSFRRVSMRTGASGKGKGVAEPIASQAESETDTREQAASTPPRHSWRTIGRSVPETTEDVPVPRPMLRREIVKPDVAAQGYRRSGGKDPHEVVLLSRIVENPRDSSAYEELGDWYFAGHAMQDAKECYRQALKLRPTNRAVKIKIRRLEKVFEDRAR